MSAVQLQFDFAPRPKMRLSDIQRFMKDHAVVGSAPSRGSLIALCEDGTLEAIKTRYGWLVFIESFEAWVRSMDQPEQFRRAA